VLFRLLTVSEESVGRRGCVRHGPSSAAEHAAGSTEPSPGHGATVYRRRPSESRGRDDVEHCLYDDVLVRRHTGIKHRPAVSHAVPTTPAAADAELQCTAGVAGLRDARRER